MASDLVLHCLPLTLLRFFCDPVGLSQQVCSINMHVKSKTEFWLENYQEFCENPDLAPRL